MKSKTDQGKKIYSFETSDGVPSKKGFRDSELLMADSVNVGTEDDILVLYPGYGFLGVLFGDYASKGKTILAESSDRAFQISNHNLKKNDIENASCIKIASLDEINELFDKIIYAPKPYDSTDVVKNRIAKSLKLLKENGQFFLVSSKDEGLNRYKNWLKELGGDLEKINSRNKYHTYRFTKSNETKSKKISIEKEFKAEVDGTKAHFETEEGLFSPNRLDEGSKLLIQNVKIEENDRVWDVACGYGAIGIFLKKMYDCDLYLSDDDMRAVELSKINLDNNGIKDYNICNADCLDCFHNQKFDIIVSNPPTHQGQEITDEIFEESYSRLKEGGKLYLVYNQNMKFENTLEVLFDYVEVIERKNNFAVTKAIK